ncbi:MAG: phage holin family protein [Caldilineales bacterium]|nr:phage holin family protein [Caldilineales bacterium]
MILTAIVAVVIAAVVLLVVSRLNLGLTVDGLGSAIIAAIVIAIVGWVVNWLLGLVGVDPAMGAGILGAIVYLVVAAVVLLLADRFLPGMQVKGFVGAIVAAIGIGVVTWVIVWLLGLLGISV